MTPDALSALRHELRTPLNHVIGYAEMLLEDDPPALAAGLRRLLALAQSTLAQAQTLLGNDEAATQDVAALHAKLSLQLPMPLAAMSAEAAALQGLARPDERADVQRIAAAVAALQALLESPPVDASVPTAGGQPRVLVVDDDEGNRHLLARRLQRDGCAVMSASGGAEALALLAKEPVDLVLLDVMMPGLDGPEVLRRMKADETLADIPVLMVSALDEHHAIARCIELGAEDVLPKPFDPVILRARVGACLEKKRLRDRDAQHLDELARWNQQLETRVAQQLAQLEKLTRLKRFFSPALAEAIVDGGASDPLLPHRREVVVVFVDLRGFTAFAETAAPEEVMALLREYHGTVGPLVLAHEGTLERFTGDGLMVFFNDPQPLPDAADRAVRMALAIREQVGRLASAWQRLGFSLGVGIGIAQGYATIGAIGFEGRWDYGAIGSVTNLAARLCAEAPAGGILCTPRVAAGTTAIAVAVELGERELKGFARPVTICTLTPREDGMSV